MINGIDAFDRSGSDVSNAGDINGYGFDDLIIGARYADPNGNINAGESYVVFGSSSGFRASLNISSLDSSNGFVLNGIDSGDRSSDDLSSAGDFNGDGFDDLIIGASNADPNGKNRAGESYVVFGFATDIQLTTIEDAAVNILASTILSRYTDAEGDTLRVSDFTSPVNGTLTLNDNGTVVTATDEVLATLTGINTTTLTAVNFTIV